MKTLIELHRRFSLDEVAELVQQSGIKITEVVSIDEEEVQAFCAANGIPHTNVPVDVARYSTMARGRAERCAVEQCQAMIITSCRYNQELLSMAKSHGLLIYEVP